MSNDKSRLLANLKKTLAVGLPVMAISGFVPTALTVGAAQAEGETKVVAEAKSEAESKYGKAKAEAEGEAKHAQQKLKAKLKQKLKAKLNQKLKANISKLSIKINRAYKSMILINTKRRFLRKSPFLLY